MRRVLLAAVVASLFAVPALADDYRFTVHNNSDQDIVKIEVSEDGENWGVFDIGDGIAAEGAEELVWAESTNDSGCEWLFRATFEEGYVANSDPINFCEEGVEINFDFGD